MGEAEKEAIRSFLRKFKEIATKGRGIDIVNRSKNMQALANLGFTKKNCREEILGLSVDHYCDGPKRDQDKPGEIWEFGKLIEGNEVYIKLKIADVEGEKIAKCISFHVAEYPLCFPFKEDSKERGNEK